MKPHTPAIKQYLQIKSQYPDSILFFRMGDFYEMFFEDAHIGSRELGHRSDVEKQGASGRRSLRVASLTTRQMPTSRNCCRRDIRSPSVSRWKIPSWPRGSSGGRSFVSLPRACRWIRLGNSENNYLMSFCAERRGLRARLSRYFNGRL